MRKLERRELVSFTGKCPYLCKHCYTDDIACPENQCIEDAVQSIKGKNPDIIYVSHNYENFSDQKRGLELCRRLYDEYHTDLFIISRANLTDQTIGDLIILSELMKKEGHRLIYASSIFSTSSYCVSESETYCPKPQERIDTIRRVHNAGIMTLLMLRPVFPKQYVSMEQYDELINGVVQYVDAVVTSGLIVTDRIIKKLGWKKEELKFGPNLGSEYLSVLDEKDVYYLDVSDELKYIFSLCKGKGIACFTHSMDALNWLYDNE